MPLCSKTLLLETDLDDNKVNLLTVLEAWDEILRNSVEVASSSNAASVFEFSANECIYFASINRYLPQDKAKASKEKQNTSDRLAKPVAVFSYVYDPLTISRSTNLPQPSNAPPHDADIWNALEDDLWQDHDSAIREGDRDQAVDLLYGSSIEHDCGPKVSYPLFPNNAVPSQAAPQATETERPSETIGVIYLASAQFSGEVNLGLALAPSYRGKDLGREAVSLLLKWAFDEARYHRVQAMLMEGPGRDTALKLFTALGFAHEGTRRRQVLSAFSGEYKDVTCVAILDTEWCVRNSFRHAPNNLWDELFERHQREREELLEWEAGRSKMKRTQSMETVRIKVDDAALLLDEDPAAHNSRHAGTTHAILDGPDDFAEFRHGTPSPVDWEDTCNVVSPAPPASMSANSPSPSERWEIESNRSASSVSNRSRHPLLRDSASPPPPSEASNSSGWEIESDSGGSSTSWDKLETSSVASSGLRSISEDDEMA